MLKKMKWKKKGSREFLTQITSYLSYLLIGGYSVEIFFHRSIEIGFRNVTLD